MSTASRPARASRAPGAPRPAARSRRCTRSRRSLRVLAAAALVAAPLLAPVPALADDPTVADHSERAAAGEAVTFTLTDGAEGIDPSTTRLLLDGMSAGTTLTADGRRAVVPGQGVWQISDDGTHATFAPSGTRAGTAPTPIPYTAADEDGELAAPAVLTVLSPVLPDMVRAASYGRLVHFDLKNAQENVSPGTITLRAVAGTTGSTVSEDGTRLVRDGQGTWTLDRDAQRVTFTPQDSTVRTVDPISVIGTDSTGDQASPGLLHIGYPKMLSQSVADEPGQPVQFRPMDSASSVRADSLRLTATGLPEGSKVSEGGKRLTVPGEGTWSVDDAALTVAFTPVSASVTAPTPVRVTMRGLYADNTTTARLRVQYTSTSPIPRADRLRGVPGRPVTADLLANDTPGSAALPLDASSVRLRSIAAIDVDGKDDARGRRLVMPGEGVYSVQADGVLTFTPEQGFAGRATPIQYSVVDARGVQVTAPIRVDIDPQAPAATDAGRAGGINSVLQTLRPARTATFAVFACMTSLLLFAGVASLWIGTRMETERRS